jgi:hypothetical protein
MMKINKKAGMLSFVIIALVAVLGLGVGTLYNHGNTVLNDNTYMAMVSHTEYASGETGQIVARLVNYLGNPIVATCYATIKYPDKSAFITNQSMTASTISGNYYKTFTTPAIEGVYEYQARCYYGVGQHADATNSFHLSPALNTISEVNQTVNYLKANLNTTMLYNALVGVNASLRAEIASMNATMVAKFTSLNNSMATHFANLNQSIKDELTAVNSSLWNKINSINFAQTNYTSRFNSIDGNLSTILYRQTQINSTVNNIYTYLSVNVATTLNSILNNQVQINKTVNYINATSNEILANQQNQVFMTVVSG